MDRLKNLRKEKGYTQIKMQLLTGIDQSDYSKIEKGKRYYTFEQCKRIALALDTSMDYLAGLTNEPRPYPRAGEADSGGKSKDMVNKGISVS
ncbi:MAG: helix-turn-helix domain-containing protein [Roseburia sp.]|nr:helix-turn-helix domain-containing protein [Ruminococcus sp.]MCM1153736.1 helix-turn-helix domain-containing protein [Roseburia sp.]MCM1242187.1 helix-turn-helix domain-containing protein [Roseburia sp.]